jgi:predicted DNA-binding protein
MAVASYTISVYNNGMKKDAKQTSIRLTSEAKELIERLSQKLGINQTSVIEMAIRVLAEKEKVR